mmetsp:Transcript_133058/g.315382  ORF Transcript_133058/g.315382 Transcript_133058/m.315382 type:complete len:144 (-) Transcript_133058:63-494(-)
MPLDWLWDSWHHVYPHETSFFMDKESLRNTMADLSIGRRAHAALAEGSTRELQDMAAAHKAMAGHHRRHLEADAASQPKAPGRMFAALDERPAAKAKRVGRCSFFPEAGTGRVTYQCCNQDGCKRAKAPAHVAGSHNDLVFRA